MTGGDRVPFVDLAIQHSQIADEIASGWDQVIDQSSFILGPFVERFERAFADFCGVRHCVGVGNGTDALELALRAVGVQVGDEVIVPANTFVASAAAVQRIGAIPILVDVSEGSFLLDVEQVAGSLSDRTKAIMPVHLYGQIAPIELLGDLIDGHDIAIVEDAAQAHGASRWERPIGRHGAITGTSFYPGKNLGAYGDAGAVLVDDPERAQRLRRLRNLGSLEKHRHGELGFNSRLDPIQAVVLSAKLLRLDAWNQQRRVAAERYNAMLRDVPEITPPEVLRGNEHVWHLYVVRLPRRDEVMAYLAAKGIETGIHYPVPLHLQGAFSHLGYGRGDHPVTERLSQEILSLPMFPGISEGQQERVVEALKHALRHAA